ncbi:MAG: c-type cytochrome [Pseudomonadota bacterium]|nr:c-type cytochrome [Pseudomonadota bacterium]
MSRFSATVFSAALFCAGGLSGTAFAADNPARSGKQVYDTGCAMCHASGAAGAPKFGDAVAWSPRIAQGDAKMFEHVVKGFKAMPARGTCSKCTDAELKAAIAHMVAEAQGKK